MSLFGRQNANWLPQQVRVNSAKQKRKTTDAGQLIRRQFSAILRVIATVAAAAGILVLTVGGSASLTRRIASCELAFAWVTAACFAANFVASILYLVFRDTAADALAVAAAEVGLFFCTTMLGAGSLWTHQLMAVWWTWDAVLTVALLAWPIYMSYFVLRHYANPGQPAVLAAVLAVFAFLDLPLVYASVSVRKLHIASGAKLKMIPIHYQQSFSIYSCFVFTVVGAGAIWVLYRKERIQQEAASMPVNDAR